MWIEITTLWFEMKAFKTGIIYRVDARFVFYTHQENLSFYRIPVESKVFPDGMDYSGTRTSQPDLMGKIKIN